MIKLMSYVVMTPGGLSHVAYLDIRKGSFPSDLVYTERAEIRAEVC
jgi:hypothetical protein